MVSCSFTGQGSTDCGYSSGIYAIGRAGARYFFSPSMAAYGDVGAGGATLNVGLTVGWLIRLFARRDPEFHRLRRAAVIATLGAQPVFLFFPVAPPRTLGHFVDTIADVSGVDLDSGLIAKLYDPIAAMPSIHVTYAVVTAAGIAETSGSALARALAPAYPPVVTLVVFATANHYVLDAIAGATLGLAALRLARRLS